MSEDGKVLAEWLLLSNIKDVDAATLVVLLARASSAFSSY
jgi:hypothetical protein